MVFSCVGISDVEILRQFFGKPLAGSPQHNPQPQMKTASRFFQWGDLGRKPGSLLHIPANSTYVEFVPGFSTSKFGLGTPF